MVEHVCGERMAQVVRCHPTQVSSKRGFFEDLTNTRTRKWMRFLSNVPFVRVRNQLSKLHPGSLQAHRSRTERNTSITRCRRAARIVQPVPRPACSVPRNTSSLDAVLAFKQEPF